MVILLQFQFHKKKYFILSADHCFLFCCWKNILQISAFILYCVFYIFLSRPNRDVKGDAKGTLKGHQRDVEGLWIVHQRDIEGLWKRTPKRLQIDLKRSPSRDLKGIKCLCFEWKCKPLPYWYLSLIWLLYSKGTSWLLLKALKSD